ncbi:uncharacterized protein LOC110847287 [Folsomia candida]|uniref:uncharacterized protein LOC110847287 n=1 Tax=Folsomia candida TaxID=158441 RepID=UPI000B8F27B1|nr:uncharacterized protein LOC110847287 [Folsomia candida]
MNVIMLLTSLVLLSFCTKVTVSQKNKNFHQTNVRTKSPKEMNSDSIPLTHLEPIAELMKINDVSDFNNFPHRMKRGIIWNKIKKVKSGIWSAKKKIWRIKQKAVEIAIGKDYETPKPHYESTGGSWGRFQKQVPKRNLPSLSGVHGPPYHASSKGIIFPENGWSNNDIKSQGSSTKLTYADLLAIYRLPMNLEALRKLQKMDAKSRRL